MKKLDTKILPTITIITSTYNTDLKIFERVLKAIKSQNYPKKLIEHIVMDAGSTNGTIKLARNYHCKVIVRKDLLLKEHARQGLAYKMAKGKICLILHSDNLFTSKDWLMKMVEPFLVNKKVFATFPEHYGFHKKMTATTRYGALIGANEPIISSYFLGKIEKTPLPQTHYDKGTILKETEDHYIVKYNRANLPALGENGQMVLKKVMDKVNKDPFEYQHIDAFTKMFYLGYDTCGVIKTSLIHFITPDIVKLIQRRIHVKETFFDERRTTRPYLIFDWKNAHDRWMLLKFVFFSLFFVGTFYQSIRGYLKIRDSAWFLHPVICFLMLLAYGFSEIKWIVKKKVLGVFVR